MTMLKRVSPGSAFKIGLVVYGILGLILGAICSVIAMVGVQFAPHSQLPFAGRIGVFAIILCPIIYGLIGGIGAAIAAWFYNLASGWVGGLEVDLGQQ
jgi:hypothetical protein